MSNCECHISASGLNSTTCLVCLLEAGLMDSSIAIALSKLLLEKHQQSPTFSISLPPLRNFRHVYTFLLFAGDCCIKAPQTKQHNVFSREPGA